MNGIPSLLNLIKPLETYLLLGEFLTACPALSIGLLFTIATGAQVKPMFVGSWSENPIGVLFVVVYFQPTIKERGGVLVSGMVLA